MTGVQTCALPIYASRRRGDESQTEKENAGKDKSESLLTSSPTNGLSRFSRWLIMLIVLMAYLAIVDLLVSASASKAAWGWNLFIVFVVGWIILSQVWRATQSQPKGAPFAPAANPKQFNKKAVWLIGACYSAIILIQVFQWWSKREPIGVWFPDPIDASVSGEYGEALIHVTDVSQQGAVVVIKLACDTAYPERGLYVEYSGQLFDYSAAASATTNLDCLVAPRFNNGEDRILAGTTNLKGKPIYRIGFVLADAAIAAKVVEQVKQVHLGKPRGLDQNNCVLHLFEFHRRVGDKSSGQPVREGLAGILVWQPKHDATANSKPAAAPKLTFGPVMERVVQPERARLFGLISLGLNREFALRQQTNPGAISLNLVDVDSGGVAGTVGVASKNLDWLVDHNIDLLATMEKGQLQVSANGLALAKIKRADFDNAIAGDILNDRRLANAKPTQGIIFTTETDDLTTWLFHASGGGVGVLSVEAL